MPIKPPRPDSIPLLVHGTIKTQTEKAWLFSDGIKTEWLPKSRCQWDEAKSTMIIPLWLVREKKFGTIPDHIAGFAVQSLHKLISTTRKIIIDKAAAPDDTIQTTGATTGISPEQLKLPLPTFIETHIDPVMQMIVNRIDNANTNTLPIITYKNIGPGTNAEYNGIHLTMNSEKSYVDKAFIVMFDIAYKIIEPPPTVRRFRNIELY